MTSPGLTVSPSSLVRASILPWISLLMETISALILASSVVTYSMDFHHQKARPAVVTTMAAMPQANAQLR